MYTQGELVYGVSLNELHYTSDFIYYFHFPVVMSNRCVHLRVYRFCVFYLCTKKISHSSRKMSINSFIGQYDKDHCSSVVLDLIKGGKNLSDKKQ